MPQNPSRSPSGVSTTGPNDPLAMYGAPDPTKYHTFFDDFDKFYTADWVITTTEAGAGDASEAIGNLDGGVLVLTNDGADNDADYLQFVKETFKFQTGKQLWFKTRMKVSDATQIDFVFGLQITDTTPLGVTDGVFFLKNDDDALLNFYVIKDSVATAATALKTLANDTYYEFAFYYNGVNAIEVYVDAVKLATVAVTNLPDDEELAISYGLVNGSANARSMSIDYIFVAKER